MRQNDAAVTTVKLPVIIATCGVLLASLAAAEEPHGDVPRGTVPRTFDGAGEAFKEGGREIGYGFRGIGRGLKNTFTGRSSAADYRESKEILTGFKDVGRGIAGGARAVGGAVKRGIEDGD